MNLRTLPPCAKHKEAENLGNGHYCRIPRIDNALVHAPTCDECLAIVKKAASETLEGVHP